MVKTPPTNKTQNTTHHGEKIVPRGTIRKGG
nr:MAG TPA: hypothetical protein [Caudoviricetes sp.]